MTVKLLTSPYRQFQTLGASYTADDEGVIIAASSDVLSLIHGGCGLLPAQEQGINNLTAVTDPGVGDDLDDNYVAGSSWLNVTLGRLWTCVSNASGAATWAFNGCIIGKQVPSTVVTQLGAAVADATFGTFKAQGMVHRVAANPIAANAADTTDDILVGIVLPIGIFDVAKRGVKVRAAGKLGATANDKRIKIWANATLAGSTTTAGVVSGGTVSGVGSGVLLYDSGTVTGNAVGFSAILDLIKYGAAASNTQVAQVVSSIDSAIATSVPAFTTLAESATITIVVTSSSLTTGAAADVSLNLFEVNAAN